MWMEFEWENKVAVNTSISKPSDFVAHICKATNMRCLTPLDESDEARFLVANLYAKSVFGEDALANISIEKPRRGYWRGIFGFEAKRRVSRSRSETPSPLARRGEEKREEWKAVGGGGQEDGRGWISKD